MNGRKEWKEGRKEGRKEERKRREEGRSKFMYNDYTNCFSHQSIAVAYSDFSRLSFGGHQLTNIMTVVNFKANS